MPSAHITIALPVSLTDDFQNVGKLGIPICYLVISSLYTRTTIFNTVVFIYKCIFFEYFRR